MKKNIIIYITFDGLSDPLGKSQILPYLERIKFNYNLKIFSLEKKKPKKKILFKSNINCHYLIFEKNKNKLLKIINYVNFLRFILLTCKNYNVKIIHCRGYPSALIGIVIKLIKKSSLIYDMRGFWVDEKKDSLTLNLEKLKDRIIFYTLKKFEKIIIKKSDFIVVLTNKAKYFVNKNFNYKNKNISVIPCSVNYAQFNFKKYYSLNKFTYSKLSLKPNQKILVYVGSYGEYYMSNEVLNIYFNIKKKIKNFSLLIITNNKAEFKNLITKFNDKKDIRVINLDWKKIPEYLSVCNLAISLIKPTFAKIASTPTKISEGLAMGLPIISNKNIGDLDDMIKLNKLGCLVDLNKINHITTLRKLLDLFNLKKIDIRKRSRKYFDIEYTVKRYNKIYESLF